MIMKPIVLRNEKMKNSITSYLAALEALVRQRTSLKLYDINQHCEEFYCELLNEVLKCLHPRLKLVSENTPAHPNYPGVDLVDQKKHVIVQVTSSATNKKVAHTFYEIKQQNKHSGFTLYFIFIAGRSEKIDLRKNRPPKFITCKREHLLYPEDLTALLHGKDSKKTNRNYERVLKILQYYLGAEDHKMSVDACWNFINQVVVLVKSVDHVRCMCEEFMQDPKGNKTLDDVRLKRINHQVSNHIPNSSPDLSEMRQIWARNARIYAFLLEIGRLVFEIDCTGRENYRLLDVGEVKRLVEKLLKVIYDTIRAMCKESDISEEVAFTELMIKANEV